MEKEIKKIAVLGSNSFTGSHFVNHVLENSKTEVIGISRSAEYNPIFMPYLYKKPQRPARFRYYRLDLNKNIQKVINLIDREKPEVVVNYVAQGEVRNSWKWPEQWFQTNCMSVVKLANALKGKSYLKRYVAISTPEVYGATKKGMAENFNFYPSTPYAASKLAGDLFLFTLFKRYGFPVVMTRSANVYGIHQQLYRIIPRTVIYLKLGKKIELNGGGKAVRSFIHAKDAADAVWRAITKGKNGEVYHIAPENEEMSIKDLVKMICEIMGKDFKASTKVIEENFSQDVIYSLDSAKARKELRWKETIRLKDGILETIQWIGENWKEIKNKPLGYAHKV